MREPPRADASDATVWSRCEREVHGPSHLPDGHFIMLRLDGPITARSACSSNICAMRKDHMPRHRSIPCFGNPAISPETGGFASCRHRQFAFSVRAACLGSLLFPGDYLAGFCPKVKCLSAVFEVQAKRGGSIGAFHRRQRHARSRHHQHAAESAFDKLARRLPHRPIPPAMREKFR